MLSLRTIASRHCNVPAHIYACAELFTQHLHYSSEWAIIPAAGIEHVTEIAWWDTQADAQAACKDKGDRVVLIAEDIASVLRAYVPTLPARLYVNHEWGGVSETAPRPKGWLNENNEPCDEGAPGATYIDGTGAWSVYTRWNIACALFGALIASEFS